VTEQPVRAGIRIRPQPVAHIDRQDQLTPLSSAKAAVPPAPYAAGTRRDAPIDSAVQRTMPTPVLRGQRELDQRPHRAVRAEQGVTQLEQRVAPPGQTRIQLRPEGSEVDKRIPRASRCGRLMATAFVLVKCLCDGAQDQARAALTSATQLKRRQVRGHVRLRTINVKLRSPTYFERPSLRLPPSAGVRGVPLTVREEGRLRARWLLN